MSFEKPEYNRLLNRQLRHAFKEQEPTEELLNFIHMVNEAYQHYDSTRELLERSMDISTIELQRKNRDLMRINETLDDFNHSISHDLKTHAVNVISLVKLLKKYTALDRPNKVEDIITKLEMVGKQLNNVIHGFLEISKFEHLLEPTKENVSVNDLVQELKDEFRQRIEETKAKLTFQHDSMDRIYASKAHLKVILRNIISNGLKYHKPGNRAEVRVVFFDHESQYSIVVSDDGIGMDMSKNETKLFTMFSRLENHSQIEGTGIGMFLVKRLIDKSGGDIAIESEPGKGTTVRITFEKQKLDEKI